MACRRPANPIVEHGKWKGYRKEDADDAYWAEGYSLPKLPNYEGWRLQVFAVKSISDAHLNIERLPTLLRHMVNEYHAVYGVGKIEDIKIFNVRCWNHQGESNGKCRQCRARREAAKLVIMKKLGTEISRGLLVRRNWVPPKPKDEKQKQEIEELRKEDPIGPITSGRAQVKGRPSRWFHSFTMKPRDSEKREEIKEQEEIDSPTIVCHNCSLRGNRAVMKVMKLTENATIPTRGSFRAAGYDLYSAYRYVITPGRTTRVLTDIAVELPPGSYGRIAPRSSLAMNSSISIGGGVIDPDYTGNVGVLICNGGQNEFAFNKGDRCAQLIIEKIYMPEVIEVKSLRETVRGDKGYGSTGT